MTRACCDLQRRSDLSDTVLSASPKEIRGKEGRNLGEAQGKDAVIGASLRLGSFVLADVVWKRWNLNASWSLLLWRERKVLANLAF